MSVAPAFGCLEIPCHRDLNVIALERIRDLSIAVAVEDAVVDVRVQELWKVVLSCDFFELRSRHFRWPTSRLQQLDVLFMLNSDAREANPHHQIHEMRGHIDYSVTLLSDIEIPRRALERPARNRFAEMMNALFDDGWLRRASRQKIAKQFF